MQKLEEYAPNERKIVYFIDDIAYNNLGYKEEGKELLTNPEVLLVPMKKSEEFLDNYIIMENIQPYNGMTLTISPYDRTKYSEVVEANENFAVEKFANILRICNLIGAKNVKTEKVFVAKQTEEQNMQGSVGIKAFSGSLESKSTYLNEKVNRLLYEATYSGVDDSAKEALKKMIISNQPDAEKVLKNMEIEKLDIKYVVDKNTFYPTEFEMKSVMKVSEGNQSVSFDMEMKVKYSDINKVKEIVIPDEVKNAKETKAK